MKKNRESAVIRFAYCVPLTVEKKANPHTPIERVSCTRKDAEGNYTIQGWTWAHRFHRPRIAYDTKVRLNPAIKKLRSKLKKSRLTWIEQVVEVEGKNYMKLTNA